MSRIHQELLAMKNIMDGFAKTGCSDQDCDDCPVDTMICMAIADPNALVKVIREEYLKQTGFWNIVFDWLKVKVT